MTNRKWGIIGTSHMEDERRVPIHPEHLSRLPKSICDQLIFETGYGAQFGISDKELEAQSGGIASRDELLADVGAVVIPKPTSADLNQLCEGGILWGYLHCVQQRAFTQVALDRKQTLIGFEDMYVWGPDGICGRHTFYKNNEMAGYCAVLHALQLKGIDGHYGNQRKVVIFSFGAVSRGAIYALKAHGFRDITICIQRPDHEVREEVLDCNYVRLQTGKTDEARLLVVDHDGTTQPLTEMIGQTDIIINGTFQDPDCPMMFVSEEEISCFKPGSLIIDISCDEGMGFSFATPTTFKQPLLKIGTVDYYAVDHTPSYLWESASRSISAALVVHLPSVAAGREGWLQNETVQRAINIDEGVIKNPAILSFQRRKPNYPHASIEPIASDPPQLKNHDNAIRP